MTEVEVIARITDQHEPMTCVCTNIMDQVIHASSIRFKGPGFYKTDHQGHGARYQVASPARQRHRQQIRDAHDAGELESPSPAQMNPRLNDFYGEGAEKPITDAVKNFGEKIEQDVKLPSNEMVTVRRKNKTDFDISKKVLT